MKGIEDLQKRLEAIEKAAGRKAIILNDGTKWIPKIRLLDMLVDLMDFECGESPEDLHPEFYNEAAMWAKYELRHGDPPFYGSMSLMARNLIERDMKAAII